MTEPKHGSPEFYALLEEMSELHDKKSYDYASNDNPYGNYEFAGELSCLFSHSPKDAGFVGRIGEKFYRLANLERDNKIPKNESIEDTERDIVVITALWIAARRSRRKARSNIVATLKEKMDGGEWTGFPSPPLTFKTNEIPILEKPNTIYAILCEHCRKEIPKGDEYLLSIIGEPIRRFCNKECATKYVSYHRVERLPNL